ncbi:MAG TPA: hypothetical protein VMV36_07475 [Ignavibacteriaceae bacterium]|nr:hypothetical protein [Ignavibacteriaceae bacterium]
MKKYLLGILFVATVTFNLFAQSPGRKNLGFGIILGEPTGVTVKYWTDFDNAFVFDLGSSYFGSPRLDADYLWHFNAFNSDMANLYAGPGLALGFGEGHGFWDKTFRANSGTALGIRGVFGVDVLPRRTPLEIFGEIGVLVGLTPDFGSGIDGAIGIRFYPSLN